ncbi:MAG: hypothetical protein AAF968_22020 [Pseudomonadota bacterium]
MADLSKLKRAQSKASKGTPPPADSVEDITQGSARLEDAPQRPLQVRIPAPVFEAFSEAAGREFGFSHGAKKRLFLKMWALYQAEAARRD